MLENKWGRLVIPLTVAVIASFSDIQNAVDPEIQSPFEIEGLSGEESKIIVAVVGDSNHIGLPYWAEINPLRPQFNPPLAVLGGNQVFIKGRVSEECLNGRQNRSVLVYAETVENTNILPPQFQQEQNENSSEVMASFRDQQKHRAGWRNIWMDISQLTFPEEFNFNQLPQVDVCTAEKYPQVLAQ